ncbi:MAG: Rpp14/Pop5 family protein [Hadesarchaea archaeon]|nr:Rpp14/Pop5 family protein [Hadesarchaea archaeon]
MLVKLALYDESSQRGLLRCGHHQLDEIKTSMAGAGEGAKGAPFRIIGVSGTMRAAKRKFLALAQEKVK